MAIGERYEDILEPACDVVARRRHQASTREIARAAGLSLARLSPCVEHKELVARGQEPGT